MHTCCQSDGCQGLNLTLKTAGCLRRSSRSLTVAGRPPPMCPPWSGAGDGVEQQGSRFVKRDQQHRGIPWWRGGLRPERDHCTARVEGEDDCTGSPPGGRSASAFLTPLCDCVSQPFLLHEHHIQQTHKQGATGGNKRTGTSAPTVLF